MSLPKEFVVLSRLDTPDALEVWQGGDLIFVFVTAKAEIHFSDTFLTIGLMKLFHGV